MGHAGDLMGQLKKRRSGPETGRSEVEHALLQGGKEERQETSTF